MSKSKKVLTAAEVESAVDKIEQMMGPEFMELVGTYGINANDTLSFLILGLRCMEERESRGLTIKKVSSEIKVPQYRLRAIEHASLSSVKPEYLRKYISYLGIEKWVRGWSEEYPKLARAYDMIEYSE